VGGGTVRIFCFPWLRFGVFGTIVMGEGGGTVRIFIFPGSILAGTVRLKWRGCAAISFSFSLVSCHYSWRADMRGRNIVLYFFVVFCSGFFWFLIYKLLIVDNFLTGVFGEFCSLRRTWSLCLGALDLIISVPIWELKRTLLSWCFYILKRLSLSEQWCQERGYVCCDLWPGK
jgi:hypothetical protein